MRSQANRRKSFKGYFLFGLILVVLMIIIVSTVGKSHFNAPQKIGLNVIGVGQSVVTKIVGGVNNIWKSYVALWDVRRLNGVLQEELNNARQDNQKHRESIAENIRLRKLLDLKDELKPPSITAQIIGRDPSLWFRTLIIDRGSAEGIATGMPVLTVEGVVGQILETSRNSAKVILAHDPNSAIDALIQKNRVQGILKGLGNQQYKLQYILKNANVEEGDMIVTSGLGGGFPKGIPLGKVKSITKRST